MPNTFYKFSLLFVFFFVIGCDSVVAPEVIIYHPVDFSELPGWSKDHIIQSLPAIQKSCRVLLNQSNTKPMRTRPDATGQVRDWHPFCQSVMRHKSLSEVKLREIIHRHLVPHRMIYGEHKTGRMTGYYEPLIRGSYRRSGVYQTPVYKKPPSNISCQPRASIVRGGLAGRGLELLWVNDPVDLFFLHIQGSGRVLLDDGRVIRIGYDGANSHAYYAIGKTFIERGIFSKDTVSLDNMKIWLRNHPNEAESIMSLNESYVFFRFLDEDGAIGSQGISITPERTLAVDPKYISLGTLVWIHTPSPFPKHSPLQRMMVAQDTGGAIKGPLRCDFFWGFGRKAEQAAGCMNSQAEIYVLLPRPS